MIRTTPAVRSALAAAFFVVAAALVPVALADEGGNLKGGGGTSTSTTSSTNTAGGGSRGGGKPTTAVAPLTLTSEYVWNSPNPSAPTWCMNEDDVDKRAFYGSLNGSYSTSYQLCDPAADYSGGMWWDAGGEGLESDVYVVGQLNDLTITAPGGTARHAVLMGTSASKGVTTYHYAVCDVPPYYISTDTGTSPLAGGTWQITLSGQITKASWVATVTMTDATFQQNHCPPSEQNLLP